MSDINTNTCSPLKCWLTSMVVLCLQNKSGRWPLCERNNPCELKMNPKRSAGLLHNSNLCPNWHTQES